MNSTYKKINEAYWFNLWESQYYRSLSPKVKFTIRSLHDERETQKLRSGKLKTR